MSVPLGADAPDGEAPPPGLNLELLVHGVGGTTPEEMLNDPRTERVTGDHTAAVYRRADDVDAESRPQDYRDEPIAEAYSWSNLTSGNGARALWLILLPFMVVNLAHWARPAADSRRRAVRVHGVVVRLVALSLTVLLTAAACEVALDLVAWQCAGTAGCVADHSWLGFMGVDAAGEGGWWSQPGRRLALAAVVPALLTGLLWWLSHRTWAAYESQPPLDRPAAEDGPAAELPPLSRPGFWYGKRIVARLRAAHTAAGFLTVAAGVAAATTRYDRKPGGSALLDGLGWLTELLIVAASLWVVYVVVRRGRKERAPDTALDRFTVSALPGISLGVLLLAAVHACLSRPGWESVGRELPGDETFGVIAVVQGTLAVGLALLGLRLYRRTPVPRTALHGLGAGAIAMLACGLGGVMSGGVAQRVADWLDGEGTPGTGDGGIKGPPVMLTWQASILPVLLGLLVLLLCWYAYRLWRSSKLLTAEVDRRYPESYPDPTRSRRIGGAIARAGLTDSAPWLVGLTALITLLLGSAAVLGTWLSHEVPGTAADDAPAIVDGFADTVQTLGSWLIGFGFLLFLALGRRAYQDASARRTIGILWDVGTFWPRAAHPFAPPCYAERAVPDLAWRMGTWTRQTGGRLVISGHSQGSVLAAAAVWHLEPGDRGRVALLTYGSPLERLYGRWFPAYFGPEQLRALHSELHCWRNLWRLTDPIGGPVGITAGDGASGTGDGATADGAAGSAPDVDRGPLLDPLAYGRTVTHPLPAPILGHGEYQADPAFAEERNQLLARLREERGTAPVRKDGDDAEAPAGRAGLPHQPGGPHARADGPDQWADGPAPREVGPAQDSEGTSSA